MNTLLPNIILEGCDCVGKSSVMKELKRLLPTHTSMHMGFPKDAEEELFNNQEQADLLSKGSALYDRSMLSSCVYGPLFRNEYPEYVRYLEHESQLNVPTILVLIHAPVDVVAKRFDGEVLEESQIPMILDTYQTEWRISKFNHKLMYDSHKLDSLDIATRILKQYEEIKHEHIAKKA